MLKPFIHLRTHTNYSLSEGMLTSKYIANFCKENLQPACGISDTSNLFGVFEFSSELLSKNVQPIIGMQINIFDENYQSQGNESLLISKNEIGYKNLIKITNILNCKVSNEKDKKINLETIDKYKEGLIILSGGAENGFLGYPATKNDFEITIRRSKRLKNYFNNNFYIEIQRHGLDRDKMSEPILLEIAKKINVPIVATNDNFFKFEKDLESQQVLTLIDKGLTISSDKTRFLSKENYLKTTDQMYKLFSDLPEALENTINIAKRCSYCLKENKPILPKFSSSENLLTENEILEDLSLKGLKKRLGIIETKTNHDKFKKYFERLDIEIEIIKRMGFSGYFLIVSDFVKWSKNNLIPVGPGRGSGAGSIVAWSLEITDLDPMRWGLLFERFLNPDRISMPDFDIDFCQERRDEVINYIKEKYGKEHVAQIITFGRLQPRAAIRDVGRVLEMPYGQVDKIAKMIPIVQTNPITLSQALMNEELINEKNKDEGVSKVIDIAIELEGLNRHVSTHAAGVVISQKPLDEIVPLYSEVGQDLPATQFNMKYIEKAGLVKFDILGLKTLTIISKTEQLIKQKYNNFNLHNISLEDKSTFQMLSSGETVGVFQLESNGMQNVLKGLRPDRFEDIIAVVALYRPGPIENIPNYINRKHGSEEVEYMHPFLKSILLETYGIFIYQEQVMQAAQILAGYTLSSADILRRAMGKKDKHEMDKQKEKFIKGAQKKGLSSGVSKEIFDQISAFAGYGFNKSHAAAYALIAYQCAWLKNHYPHEFFSCLMTYDMDNTDKLAIYQNDLKRMSISFLPPDINKSFNHFQVEYDKEKKKSIRCSLSSLKNVGSEAVKQLIDLRNDKGYFINIDDFINKTPLNILGKRGLESLIKSGSFDKLDNNRNKLYTAIPIMLRHSQKVLEDLSNNQESLFNKISNFELSKSFVDEQDWSIFTKQSNEFNSLGYYLNHHPMKFYSSIKNKLNIISSSEVMESFRINSGKIVRVSGVITKFAKKRSHRGIWASIELSDMKGTIEITYYSNSLTKLEEVYEKDKIFVIDLEVKFDRNFGYRLIEKRTQFLSDLISLNNFDIQLEVNDRRSLRDIKEKVLNLKDGKSNIFLKIKKDNEKILLNINKNIFLDSEILDQLFKIKGISRIEFT